MSNVTSFDAHLPKWISPPAYKRDAKKHLPTTMLDRGLTDRARVGTPENADFFVRTEAPRRAHAVNMYLYQGDTYRAQALAQGGKAGYTAHADMLTVGSYALGAEAYSLGWRYLPGVYHLCGLVGRQALAAEFERACREWVRDADVVHRLLHRKGDKAFLLTAQKELCQPLLEDVRRALVNVVMELEQYPAIAPLVTPVGYRSFAEAMLPHLHQA